MVNLVDIPIALPDLECKLNRKLNCISKPGTDCKSLGETAIKNSTRVERQANKGFGELKDN